MAPATRRESEATIAERVAALPEFHVARTLFGYVAIGAEADPRSLLERSRSATVFVPAKGKSSRSPEWTVWLGSEVDRDVRVSVGAEHFPAMAVVPGVGFDRTSMRLGRWQGFYDRALEALRRSGDVCVVGLAFECQIVPELPTDPWDQPMDYVVTEKRVLRSPRLSRGTGPA
jgi:5-formyltetrahydrofolate cyclo-ligase